MENMKVQTKERITQTDLLCKRNELLAKQNDHLKIIAINGKRVDEFNRMAFGANTGYQVPENANDPKAVQDFQNTQGGERDAVNDLYYSDMSVSGGLISKDEDE